MSEQNKPTDAEEIISDFQKSKEESKKQEPEPVQEPKNETIIDTVEDTPKPETTETTESVEATPEPETKEEPATETTETVEPQTEQKPEEPATETTETVEPQTEQKPEEPATEAPKEEQARSERNVIFVGKKPLMTYVTATLTQLAGLPTVTIKARGRTITQAVDVSQMIVKRMNAVGFEISDVRIASDSLESQDGRMRNVSTIEIDVSRKEP
ncbi:MAG: DNA/RNA-binding protein AlbA [Thaumarchaeota archaeon]|nr:DNA/RNA-binding protein AlbA [Nitrososphaerota archaeon]